VQTLSYVIVHFSFCPDTHLGVPVKLVTTRR
jgi:hypothetical protein